MIDKWASGQICPFQPRGAHIVVRCAGCNSIHATKNLGWRDSDIQIVSLARGLHDIYGMICICGDPGEYPVIHDCNIDDYIRYQYVGPDDGKLHCNPFDNHKHVAGNPQAKKVLESWWIRYAEMKNLGALTQEDLDELVLMRPVRLNV